MSKKPTKDEISAEIKRLEEAKTFAPHRTKFGDDNHRQIDLQVEYLKGGIDMTADEWNDYSESEQSAILDAQAWQDGQSVDGAPSDGWQSYRPKKA